MLNFFSFFFLKTHENSVTACYNLFCTQCLTWILTTLFYYGTLYFTFKPWYFFFNLVSYVFHFVDWWKNYRKVAGNVVVVVWVKWESDFVRLFAISNCLLVLYSRLNFVSKVLFEFTVICRDSNTNFTVLLTSHPESILRDLFLPSFFILSIFILLLDFHILKFYNF